LYVGRNASAVIDRGLVQKLNMFFGEKVVLFNFNYTYYKVINE